MLEIALVEMVWYSCAPTPIGSDSEMQVRVHAKSVSYAMVQGVYSNSSLIVPIAETMSRLIDRAVNEYHLHNIEEALTIPDKIENSTEVQSLTTP